MKRTLFLIEQLIAILFFALAAAVCVQLFVNSHAISQENSDLNYALILAQNGAEAFKAANGDLEYAAQLLENDAHGFVNGKSISMSYNSDWQQCESIDAAYIMEISAEEITSTGLCTGVVAVIAADAEDISEPIYKLEVVARRVGF